MKLALVGPGGIGSCFAFQLARAGHEVTVVARPGSARLQQLQRDGAVVDASGARAPVLVADALDATAYDVVVVTVLAHQLDALLPALRSSAAAKILFAQNNFHADRLQEDPRLAGRCCLGMPFVQATIDAQGRLVAKIGAQGAKTLLDNVPLVRLFAAAGLPALHEPRMPLWLRCHAPLCIGFEAVSVAAVRRGGGATWVEARTCARGAHEIWALIRGQGSPIYPGAKAWLHRLPVWVLTSMFWGLSRVRSFRELLATGVGECRAMVDAVLAAGEAGGWPPRVDAAKILAMRPSE